MTLLNNGFNEYRVVEQSYNRWDGTKTERVMLTTDNLLKAYEYVIEQEDFLKDVSEFYVGSPIELTYKINTYVNVDCK